MQVRIFFKLGNIVTSISCNAVFRFASGEGEGTGEVELGLVLKPEIVGSEPTIGGVDMLDEFKILPGPPRMAVSGVRSQSASKRNGIVPPATTV